VIAPEQENIERSPEAGLKRRQSSTTELDSDTKRRRLSSHAETQETESSTAQTQMSPKRVEQDSDRKRTRRDEERKRGQRLFGSLLGTLSQSSTSAAQRRRADIERKQQDKLKLQDEEYGELKKKRREERLAVRRKEQKLYEKEMASTPLRTQLGSCSVLMKLIRLDGDSAREPSSNSSFSQDEN
jgi:hypothetical protein